jgi:endonuclease/exonuclease/phosphatase family metal-dependent hydrolase
VTRVRVATYNIRHGRGLDGVVDLHGTAGAITQTGAEVVALQEVDRLTERTGGLDEPARLQELTGLSVAFWPTLEMETGTFGLAIAARSTFDARYEPLRRHEGERPHGVVVAQVSGIYFLCTHLSRIPSVRKAETRQLAGIARGLPGPIVVAGDLNQGRWELRNVERMGFTGDPKRRLTFPSRVPVRQIDHILAGPGARIEKSWTIRSLASDHLPLVAEVEFTERGARRARRFASSDR